VLFSDVAFVNVSVELCSGNDCDLRKARFILKIQRGQQSIIIFRLWGRVRLPIIAIARPCSSSNKSITVVRSRDLTVIDNNHFAMHLRWEHNNVFLFSAYFFTYNLTKNLGHIYIFYLYIYIYIYIYIYVCVCVCVCCSHRAAVTTAVGVNYVS
jgi:hypothetical protein